MRGKGRSRRFRRWRKAGTSSSGCRERSCSRGLYLPETTPARPGTWGTPVPALGAGERTALVTAEVYASLSHCNDVSRISQSLRKGESEHDDRQYQRNECQKNQIETLISQVHEDCGDHEDLRQCRANQQKSLQSFIDRSITQPKRHSRQNQQPNPRYEIRLVRNCV